MSRVFIVSPNVWLREGVKHTLSAAGNTVQGYPSAAALLKAEPEQAGWLLLHIPNTACDLRDIVALARQRSRWAAQGWCPALVTDSDHTKHALLRRWLNIPHVFNLTRPQSAFLPWFAAWTRHGSSSWFIPPHDTSPLSLLTEKEWVVTHATLQGTSLAALGSQLGENIKTLHARRMSVIKKLGLQTTRELQLMGSRGVL